MCALVKLLVISPADSLLIICCLCKHVHSTTPYGQVMEGRIGKVGGGVECWVLSCTVQRLPHGYRIFLYHIFENKLDYVLIFVVHCFNVAFICLNFLKALVSGGQHRCGSGGVKESGIRRETELV